jgi:hypothetical protein
VLLIRPTAANPVCHKVSTAAQMKGFTNKKIAAVRIIRKETSELIEVKKIIIFSKKNTVRIIRESELLEEIRYFSLPNYTGFIVYRTGLAYTCINIVRSNI